MVYLSFPMRSPTSSQYWKKSHFDSDVDFPIVPFVPVSFLSNQSPRGSFCFLFPRFLKPLQQGDPSLEVDLSAACQAKEEKWSPRDNACNSHYLCYNFSITIFLYLQRFGKQYKVSANNHSFQQPPKAFWAS